MTQEQKQLLLKDISARLPYNVVIRCTDNDTDYKCFLTTDILNELLRNIEYYDYKPYLRPMSSMTEEEKDKLQSLHDIISNENYGDGYSPSAWNAITEWEDYCNSRHLDYRGLIPMGLALEAPEDMYKEE